MKWFITLTFISTFTIHLTAQNNFTIAGWVSDTSFIPLNFANIVDLNTKKGASTNRFGIFFLTIPKHTTTIKISYIGYHTIVKNITEELIKAGTNDTIYINVILTPKVEELQEVKVSDEKIQYVYGGPRTTILDYDFVNDYMLLLVWKGKKGSLQLISENNSTVTGLMLSFEPENLFRDCFGNLHVISQDSVFQIFLDNQDLMLHEGYPIKVFKDFLEDCVASTGFHLYYKQYGLLNQSITYYSINKATGNKKLLKTIRDAESEYFALSYLPTINAQEASGFTGMEEAACAVKIARKISQLDVWFKIITKPTYNPLIMINDSIFVFDHVNDTCLVYNPDGNYARRLTISYHHNRWWNKTLFVDIDNKSIYAKFIKGGIVSLAQINTANGEIIETTKLEKHVFPEKIKIKGDYAYYLYYDKNISLPDKLYRQKLK